MVIVLIILSVLLFIVGYSIDNDIEDNSICFLSIIIGSASFIALCVLLCMVINGKWIDSEIAMYEEENAKIEAEISILVNQYMEYESNTLSNFAPESSITLISMYPELKSDYLVNKQMEIYVGNNTKIRELKQKKIYLSAKKWWLYFGK